MNTRTTDSPPAATSAEFLFFLVLRMAACALLRNPRKTVAVDTESRTTPQTGCALNRATQTISEFLS